METKILIVEDELGLVRSLQDRLRKEGYAVKSARDGVSGLDLATRETFDLIILDLMLPQQSGLTVCEKLRQSGSTTPILMLTARRQTVDKVIGLRTGADDYLTKPFQMEELLARIHALIRHATRQASAASSACYQFGSLRIDIGSMEVSRNDQIIILSRREFQLLRYFVEHRGATISREELLREVWGYVTLPSTRTVDTHVAWLRKKIELDPANPQLILTVTGLGHKFVG